MPHDNMPGGVVARLVTMKVPFIFKYRVERGKHAGRDYRTLQ